MFSGFTFKFYCSENAQPGFHAEIMMSNENNQLPVVLMPNPSLERRSCNFLSAWTFWFLGSWKLLGRAYFCHHWSAGVHRTGWGQVSDWAVWRESNRQCQQENQLPGHGPRQWPVQEWQGKGSFLVWPLDSAKWRGRGERHLSCVVNSPQHIVGKKSLGLGFPDEDTCSQSLWHA